MLTSNPNSFAWLLMSSGLCLRHHLIDLTVFLTVLKEEASYLLWLGPPLLPPPTYHSYSSSSLRAFAHLVFLNQNASLIFPFFSVTLINLKKHFFAYASTIIT